MDKVSTVMIVSKKERLLLKNKSIDRLMSLFPHLIKRRHAKQEGKQGV